MALIERKMKRILYIIAAALMVISCGDKKNGGNTTELTLEQKLYGEWHSTKLAIDADIYISFMENGKFEMYQQIGEGRHRHYSGEWELDGTTLSGIYSSGDDWGSGYQVSFSGDNTMSLKALNGSEEVMKYYRDAIPSEVIEGSIEMKSAVDADCGPVL